MKTATPKTLHLRKCATLMTFVFLIFFTIIESAQSLQCYKCAVFPEKTMKDNYTILTPMCSKFDESDEYRVECPFSTMCLKTIATLYLQNGQKQETITRGCAQQKDTTQVFRNRQWEQEHTVQEVYEEGCTDFGENNLAGSGKTHCYCRGKLCNAGTTQNSVEVRILIILAVIFSVYNFIS